MTHCRVALWLMLSVAMAVPASAHTRSMSYSLWDLDDTGAMVRVRVSRLELTRLALDPVRLSEDDTLVSELLASRVVLLAGDEPCAATTRPRRTPSSEGYVAYVWRVDCASAAARSVASSLLLEVAPSHLHFARVRRAGEPAVEKVLTEASPRWAIDAEPEEAAGGGAMSVGGYVSLGIEHILTGWDHLAFVAALLLLAYSLRDIAALVTSFTVAHSITLGLAVAGWVEPEGHVVEALIGFSIALVGIENAWLVSGRGPVLPILVVALTVGLAALGVNLPFLALAGLALFTACHFALLGGASRPAALRAAVAFAFGLIHGFGFAGIMMELDLANVRLAPALFGFNLGVEIGQIGVVLLLWPVLLFLRRSSVADRWVVDLGSAAVTGLGLFWFVTRSF